MFPAPAAARLSILAAALLFSTGGAAIKGTALNTFQVAGARSGVAALALLLFLPTARRGFGLDLLPAALAYAATLVCFVGATKLTTSAAAIFLQSTAPVWVLVLSPLLLRESIRRIDLVFVAAAAAGLLLVFLGSQDVARTAPHPALGNAVALASGLFYALLMVSMRRLARAGEGPDRTLAATVLGNLLAFAACLPLALPVVGATVRDAGAIVYLGVVQIGLAYWLFARGLRSLPALEVSLLVLVEPVLNPVWTWLLYDERPSPLALAGGATMIIALAVRAVMDRGARTADLPPPD
jgi:drug/metabolite transporter, DME family